MNIVEIFTTTKVFLKNDYYQVSFLVSVLKLISFFLSFFLRPAID